MRRSLIALSLAVGLVTASCSAAAPTPQIVYVTPTPTVAATPPATPMPEPTVQLTPAPTLIPAGLEFVRSGYTPMKCPESSALCTGGFAYAEFRNAGEVTGFVVDTIDPRYPLYPYVALYTAYDGEGFVLNNGRFIYAYPQVVPPGESVYLVDFPPLAPWPGLQRIEVGQPEFESLDREMTITLSDLRVTCKNNQYHVTGVAQDNTQDSSDQLRSLPWLYTFVVDKSGAPVDIGAGAYESLQRGQKIRLDFTTPGPCKQTVLKVFMARSWITSQ